jgi:hypothetical protein
LEREERWDIQLDLQEINDPREPLVIDELSDNRKAVKTPLMDDDDRPGKRWARFEIALLLVSKLLTSRKVGVAYSWVEICLVDDKGLLESLSLKVGRC